MVHKCKDKCAEWVLMPAAHTHSCHHNTVIESAGLCVDSDTEELVFLFLVCWMACTPWKQKTWVWISAQYMYLNNFSFLVCKQTTEESLFPHLLPSHKIIINIQKLYVKCIWCGSCESYYHNITELRLLQLTLLSFCLVSIFKFQNSYLTSVGGYFFCNLISTSLIINGAS